MGPLVSAICVALCLIQSGVLGWTPLTAAQASSLKFDQDAADKAATRSVTSTEPGYWLDDHDDQVPVTAELNTEYKFEDGEPLEDETVENAAEKKVNQKEIEVDEQALKQRGLFDSGAQVIGNLGQTAANLIPNRAKETAANLFRSTEGIRNRASQRVANAVKFAKDTVFTPTVQQNLGEYRKAAMEKGIGAYKELNKNLSPAMSKYLNQGVSSAVKGVAAVQNSNIGKKISETVSSLV